jgi:flagellar biosynthesis protein FlhG
MNDQAQILRGMMERRAEAPVDQASSLAPPAFTLAVASGKGGVGKSVVAVNLAVALAQRQQRVCLLDANLGLGNVDLLCGLNGYWNLSHVLSGARRLDQIVLEGPAGIHVVPGASGLLDGSDCPAGALRDVLAQLEQLERQHDYLIIDTGTGIHRVVRQFAAAARTILVVATPEPTAIADAYATLKAHGAASALVQTMLLLNRVDSAETARQVISRVQQTARAFLHVNVGSAGHVPQDPAVVQSVFRRQPFMVDNPGCPAGRAIEIVARRVMNLSTAATGQGTFFSRVAEGMAREAA